MLKKLYGTNPARGRSDAVDLPGDSLSGDEDTATPDSTSSLRKGLGNPKVSAEEFLRFYNKKNTSPPTSIKLVESRQVANNQTLFEQKI